MRSARWVLVLVAVLATAAAACGDGGPADKADEKPATTAAAETLITVPETHESIVGEVNPTTTTEPPSTTVTVPVGLPDTLGIPGAGQISLGPSSSLTNGITVRGVALDDVVAYVRQALADLGYTVNDDLTFEGPGAAGQATVAQVGDDVEIDLVLTGAPQ